MEFVTGLIYIILIVQVITLFLIGVLCVAIIDNQRFWGKKRNEKNDG